MCPWRHTMRKVMGMLQLGTVMTPCMRLYAAHIIVNGNTALVPRGAQGGAPA